MTSPLDGYTVKTYRYLRLAMVTLLFLLGSSVLIERAHTATGCFQTSISAYYYTPAQAVFVGTLVAIGVCMIVLKGSTEWEDVLLNLGGMLAPVVALVPTPDRGTCFSTPGSRRDIAADVANNIPALFVTGLVGLGLTAAIASWDRRREGRTRDDRSLGMGVALAVLVGGFGWFLFARQSFIGHAHYGAAIPLFGTIVAVVLLNARGYGLRTGGTRVREVYRNRYSGIALLMVVLPAGMWLVSRVVSWDHVVLWIEAALLLLFAAFWVSQTQELWNEGVRSAASPAPAARSA
jgi:hypothetical protein